MTTRDPAGTRWLALYALCLGDLMIVLDTNIVNVALPSIQADLSFSADALAWVVNAYMLTFGGFLLLSGRLGDLYGNRRVLLGGVAAFTVASVACAFAPTAAFLVVGRAVQGLGGAAVSAVALALIMGLFSDPGERAKAMGVFGFVMSGGGAVGVLLGGVLTGLFTWHWIFLVNVPIGIAVWVLVTRLVADERPDESTGALDVTGAALVTVALMLAVYGVVGGNDAGWTSTRTLGILATAVVLLVAFVVREARVDNPLVPLRLFTLRNVVVSQIVGVLWAGSMFACFFLSALYLQGVLGYDALQVGLAYLPSCAVMAATSVWLVRQARDDVRRPPPAGGRPGPGGRVARPVRDRPRRRAFSSSTCCPRWCCSAWARASRSTRSCSPRWATSSPTRPDSPRAWSTPRS